MNKVFIVAFGVILLLFTSINYYIGLRGWQTVGRSIPFLSKWFYWSVFWVLATSYIMVRMWGRFLPEEIGRSLTLIGSYWMAAMLYFLVAIALVDIVRVINKRAGFIPQGVKQYPGLPLIAGLTVLAIVAGIMIYGAWNAQNPIVKHYDLTVNKAAGDLKELHVIMASDLHLGSIMNKGRLEKAVGMINELEPDVVLLAGDIIDEDIGPFIRQGMDEEFRRIKAKYGVYAVTGNHEYYGGHADEIVRHLEQAGVQFLKDEYVKVVDSFYLVGRNDRAIEQTKKEKRKMLPDIMAGMDKSLPIILMDHQPYNLGEAQNAGADVQLSGHTHRGQLSPFQFITDRIFENDWGYLQKGKLHVIVSSGFGTWGPPIRTGNNPEVVDIRLRFTGVSP
ncbi:MAG: metallophosphoesterase [Clostridia bacterium]|nr:metallophosphoesterase [Clostridia bacterium]